MLLVHVMFSFSPQDRDLAMEALKSEVDTVCTMDGSIAFVPFLDATNPQNAGVLQEWETANAFAGYIASDSFSKISEILRPLLVSAPVSRRFDATLIEA
ncbi:MAG: antibiotic biosynthesis monooxygenase [Roseobacter sp.]